MIRVQQEDFDIGAEMATLTAGHPGIGAVASFVGLVRAEPGGDGEPAVTAMTLEHYPGMTERQLAAIEAEARQRYGLQACLIVHRVGRLRPGERIVLVLAASSHRQAAFEACAFLVDWLKTRAPFWKLEETKAGAQWVAAKDSDTAAARRWDLDPPA